MINRILSNRTGWVLLAAGAGGWLATNDIWFIYVALIAFGVSLLFRKMPRTILWAGLGGYASLIVPPYGFVLVIVLAVLVGMYPLFRPITPLGDFKLPVSQGKVKKQ